MKRLFGALVAVAFCACGGGNSDTGDQRSQATAASPTDVTWTQAPSFNSIPAGTIRGDASGRPFEGKTVIFEPGFESWKMIIADRALKGPTDLLQACRHLDLDLPSAPAAGKRLTKPMSYGGGYFQIDRPRGKGLFSWNDKNAWALEITAWKAKPWDPGGGVFQNAGTAAGRVIVMYESSRDDLENAWVAGTFEGAVVRYMGRPFWTDFPSLNETPFAVPSFSEYNYE